MQEQALQCQQWLHGHLYTPHNYHQGPCHIYANPLGYARKNEQERFQEREWVEV